MLCSNESDETLLAKKIRDSKKEFYRGFYDLCLLNAVLIEYTNCLFIGCF